MWARALDAGETPADATVDGEFLVPSRWEGWSGVEASAAPMERSATIEAGGGNYIY